MKQISDTSYFSKTNRPVSDESGRSLVEMLGTIAIIVMITIGGIASAGLGLNYYRTNKTRDDVDLLFQTAMDLYSWRRAGYPIGENAMMPFVCDEGGRDCSDGAWISAFSTPMKIYSTNGEDLVITVPVSAISCTQLVGTEGALWEFPGLVGVNKCPSRGDVTMRFTLK